MATAYDTPPPPPPPSPIHMPHGRKFDWSSTVENPKKTVSWAVLFSDVEHEVLPVTEGHRITLTYNLYSVNQHRDKEVSVIDSQCTWHVSYYA